MFTDWQTYSGTQLFRDRDLDAYVFSTSHMRIDADGAPTAYHPDNTGLDDFRNAGYHSNPDLRKSWWPDVLVPDADHPDRAFVRPDGEFEGYFISKTALFDRAVDEFTLGKYVDASTVPYFVLPGGFAEMEGTGRLGDFGFAVNLATGDKTAFVIADIGPRTETHGGARIPTRLGEVSIALAEALGGENVNPRTGAGQPEGPCAYMIFRMSSADAPRARWPLTLARIDEKARELIGQAGGEAVFTELFGA